MNELRALIDHLVKETAFYEELVSVLHKENEDLADRDYRALYETVCKKEHLIVHIQKMEKLRLRLIREAVAALGMPAEEVNISGIIKKADQSLGDKLEEQLSKIISIAESIKEINRVNGFIVEGCLDNVNKTLGFLGRFIVNNNYNTSGRLHGFAVKGSYLNKGA